MNAIESITEERIREMAGSDVFSRGYNYYIRGHVDEIIKTEDSVMAKVIGSGSSPYFVTVKTVGKNTEFGCTCPFGGFCKHIVSVLLSLKKGGDILQINLKRVRSNLISKTNEELADIILKHALHDTEFMRFLFTKTHFETNKSVDVAFIKAEIDRQLKEAYHVGYADVYGYVKKLEQFEEDVNNMVKGSPEKASEILLYFIKRSVDTFEDSGIDDSNGDFGSFIISLGKPYSAALKASGDGDESLAEEIVNLYFKASDYGLEDCFDKVLKVLSKKALLVMERLAHERYEQVKHKESWQSSSQKYFLLYVLALLSKRKECVKLCKEWGEKEWREELEEIERDLNHEIN